MSVLLWMGGTLLSFCAMAVAARELSDQLGIFQLLFFRSLIGLLILSIIMVFQKNTHLFLTKRLTLHLGRNCVHFAAQYGWFLGIALLPLAQVFAIEFTVPVWTALLAAIFLGEKFTLRKITAIALGILGVVIILRPGMGVFNVAALSVLGAAIGYSLAYIATKSLITTEKPLTVLFYMCVIQLPIGAVLAIDQWVTPNAGQWFWILVVAVTALSAHYCISQAMLQAQAGVVVTLDFLRLPLISIIGVLLYDETFESYLMIGAFIMLMGNLANFYKVPSGIGLCKKTTGAK